MKKTLTIIVIFILLVGCGLLGYFTYTLNEESTKYKNEINDYKSQLQQLQKDNTTSQQENNEKEITDCSIIVKGSSYVVENSGNDGSNGGPITEKTSMTFGNDNKVNQVAGTGAWEDNYSINNNVITFENSGTKSYGIISQDCKIIYIIDTQLDPAVRVYQKK